jgi:hypothetical protein
LEYFGGRGHQAVDIDDFRGLFPCDWAVGFIQPMMTLMNSIKSVFTGEKTPLST